MQSKSEGLGAHQVLLSPPSVITIQIAGAMVADHMAYHAVESVVILFLQSSRMAATMEI